MDRRRPESASEQGRAQRGKEGSADSLGGGKNEVAPLLALDSIRFRFPGSASPLLENVSYVLERGHVVVMTGPSGVGKTTLLKILAGLLKPLHGRRLGTAKTKGGFVFQTPVLLDWLTVEENVEFPHRRYKTPAADSSLTSILAWTGLLDARKFHPRELSGGMRARVQIARALYNEPDVLFLDEPFAGLDEIMRIELGELVVKRCLEWNISCVMITHSLHEAALLGDRALVMRPGEAGCPVQVIQLHLERTPGPLREAFDHPQALSNLRQIRGCMI